MRQGVNDMFHEQMKLVDQITTNIKQIGQEVEKIKFENILSKKINNVECLGKILIKQEREFISILKQQQKSFKKLGIIKADPKGKDKNEQYELESLLNESDSDEQDNNEESEESDDDNLDENEVATLEIEDWVENDDIEANGQQLIQLDDPKDKEKNSAFQKQMLKRTEHIGNVTNSIGKIQQMFSSLNEIVSQQGQTLNRLEDNMLDTKGNTGETVIELTQTVKNESPTITERAT